MNCSVVACPVWCLAMGGAPAPIRSSPWPREFPVRRASPGRRVSPAATPNPVAVAAVAVAAAAPAPAEAVSTVSAPVQVPPTFQRTQWSGLRACQ